MRYDLSNKDELGKVYKSVAYLCSRYKIKDVDDVFQSVCLKILEKPNSKANIQQFFIDALRDICGRKDNKFYATRIAIMNAVTLPDEYDEILNSGEDRIIAQIDVARMLNSLDDERARDMIIDMHLLGCKQIEVSDRYNISPAWIWYNEKWAFEDIRAEFSI